MKKGLVHKDELFRNAFRRLRWQWPDTDLFLPVGLKPHNTVCHPAFLPLLRHGGLEKETKSGVSSVQSVFYF